MRHLATKSLSETVMAEFGTRNSPRKSVPQAGSPRPQADVAEALKAVKQGRLPRWTKVGAVQLLITAALVVAVFAFAFLPAGADVWRDQRLAGTWRPAYELQARDAHCRTYQFVLTSCDAKVVSLAEPNAAAKDIGFLMLFTTGAGERLTPVRSTLDPSAVTVGYAAETELWNRTLTFVLFSASLLLAVFAMLRALARGRYKGGAQHLALLAGLETLKAGSAPAEAPRMAA